MTRVPDHASFASLVVNGTAAQVTVSGRAATVAILRASAANTNPIFIGDVTAQAFPIMPNDPPLYLKLKDFRTLYVKTGGAEENLEVIFLA